MFLLESLQDQFAVVFLWKSFLPSWLLALGERGGHCALRGSDRLNVISYVNGRTELYCVQACFA
jgi:hypothetical protein